MLWVELDRGDAQVAQRVHAAAESRGEVAISTAAHDAFKLDD